MLKNNILLVYIFDFKYSMNTCRSRFMLSVFNLYFINYIK